MPYGFYQLVRFIAMFGFGYLAIKPEEEKNKIIYIGLALLFQPFLKVSLGRGLWNIVDVMVAGWLIYSIIKENKSKI